MDTVLGPTIRHQVAFVGPLGVGKTTAVQAISDVPVLGTEVTRAAVALGGTSTDKWTTTVGIDYGEWVEPDGARIGVLGTPGQLRFAMARESIVARRGSIVLWAFGHEPGSVDETAEWMERIGDENVWARTTVALTRRESGGPDMPSIDAFITRLARYGDIQVLEADPRDRDQVADVILRALRLRPASGFTPSPVVAHTTMPDRVPSEATR